MPSQTSTTSATAPAEEKLKMRPCAATWPARAVRQPTAYPPPAIPGRDRWDAASVRLREREQALLELRKLSLHLARRFAAIEVNQGHHQAAGDRQQPALGTGTPAPTARCGSEKANWFASKTATTVKTSAAPNGGRALREIVKTRKRRSMAAHVSDRAVLGSCQPSRKEPSLTNLCRFPPPLDAYCPVTIP